MDAFVKNRSEAELIRLIKHIALSLSLEIEIESEAIEEGGIRSYFRILIKKKNRKKLKRLISEFGLILTTVLTTQLVEKIFEDRESIALDKEQKRLNIEKTKIEIENLNKADENENPEIDIDSLINVLGNDGKTIILKSNFYTHLINENRIYQISAQELNLENDPVGDEKIVTKNQFKKFIVKEIQLEPKKIEGAEIEIISPVFTEGNDNWKGIYNGEPIEFKIGDLDFKQKVLNRQLSFTTGTKILCDLEINLVLDKKGEPKIKSRYVNDIKMK
jgi:hypothetical protein